MLTFLFYFKLFELPGFKGLLDFNILNLVNIFKFPLFLFFIVSKFFIVLILWKLMGVTLYDYKLIKISKNIEENIGDTN